MIKRAIEKIDPYTKFTDNLILVLVLFTCTFFVYRDFGLRMIFGYALLCLILVLHFVRRVYHNRPLQITPVEIAFLLLSLVILVNFLRPASRHDSDSFSYIISMLVCCAYVLLAAPSGRDGQKVLQVLYTSAVFMAAYVFFFVIFQDLFWVTIYNILSETAQEYLAYYVPRGYSVTVGGCAYTNYILYLGIATSCSYVVSAPKWDKKSAFMLISGGVFLVAILFVGRRGELLAAIACCALLVFVMCSKNQRKFLLKYGAIAIVILLIIFIIFLPQLKQISVLYRYVLTIENLLNGKDITSGRMELYAIAIEAFLEKPIFGIGWDQFYTRIPQSFLEIHGDTVEDVHNIYLQFLCETGIVGAVFIIAPLGYFFYLTCKQFSRLKHIKTTSRKLTLAFDLNCSSFMLQSFLLILGIYDPCFEKVVFWCFYAVSILLLISALRLEKHQPDDVVSRFIYRVIHLFSPALLWIWRKLSVFSKEDSNQ